jgi:hypothetical protein
MPVEPATAPVATALPRSRTDIRRRIYDIGIFNSEPLVGVNVDCDSASRMILGRHSPLSNFLTRVSIAIDPSD